MTVKTFLEIDFELLSPITFVLLNKLRKLKNIIKIEI